jgi:hypothetical protein
VSDVSFQNLSFLFVYSFSEYLCKFLLNVLTSQPTDEDGFLVHFSRFI